MVQAAVFLPIISQAVKMVVDYIDQKDVTTKKLDGTWDSTVDGPRVAGLAVKQANALFDYLEKAGEIKRDDKPDKDILSTMIEAQVSSDKKEKRQFIKAATHEEIMKYLDIAVKHTKLNFVMDKIHDEGLGNYGESEKKEARTKCKEKMRQLLKNYQIYLDDEALDIYIGSITDKLLPSTIIT